MEEIKTYTQTERDWAMFCHLSAFAGYFFPFGGILGPLICWMSRKDTSAWVDVNGKSSLNFQASILLYTILAAPLVFNYHRDTHNCDAYCSQDCLHHSGKHKGVKR